MVRFSDEITPSCPLGRSDVVSIVESREGWEKVWCKGWEEDAEP